jgi:Tol biopolymer transport system component
VLGRLAVVTQADVVKTIDLRSGAIATTPHVYYVSQGVSPDGKLVATAGKQGSGFAISVANADGTNVRTVTSVPGCTDDGGPVAAVTGLQFTRDGRSLVYQSYCVEPFANLYTVGPDGSGLRRLTNAQQQQTAPALSPDGTQLVYTSAPATGLSCKGCPENLTLANADGTTIRQLTSQDYGNYNSNASWSPDGSDIAKVAAGDAYSPAWSRDGRLAWLTTPGNGGPPTLHVHGLPALRLSFFPQVAQIVWSPDGTSFAAVAHAERTATLDVYTFDLNGGNVTRLTRDIGALSLDWR